MATLPTDGRVWFADTETHLIRAGQQAPPIVCLQAGYGFCTETRNVNVYVGDDISQHFKKMIIARHPIVFFNAAFDLVCLMAHDSSLIPLIFDALNRGQILCLMLAERLYHNVTGKLNITGRVKLIHETVGGFSLAGCVNRRLSEDISEGKSSTSWRLRYSELDGKPLATWPQKAIDYAKDDVVWTSKLYYQFTKDLKHKIGRRGLPDDLMLDLPARTRASVALRLMEAWGLTTDPDRVSLLEDSASSVIREATVEMQRSGFVRDNGTLDLEAVRNRIIQIHGKSAPTTDKGAIKTDRQTLAESGDDTLQKWADAGFARKVLNTFVPIVKRGVHHPVHARYQPLVETGRTSCSNPPLQQIPRSVGSMGVRECFVPRDGMAFVAADYDAIEMRTFAQVLLDKLGYSRLAEGFIKNPHFDPHTHLAKSMARQWGQLSKKEQKDLRQRAKLANFGYAGGLGVATFLRYAAGFGLDLSETEAQTLKNGWFRAYPEVKAYFKNISLELNQNQGFTSVIHNRSFRVRGNCTFTQSANTPFQGMTADGALNALYLAVQEMYDDDGSALFGCRPAIFIHDEIVIECPIERVHEAGQRLAQVMVLGMKKYVPDVPVTAAPVAMDRWSKDAESEYDDQGRLKVWACPN